MCVFAGVCAYASAQWLYASLRTNNAQHTCTHKAVTGRVKAKMLLSRRRQSDYIVALFFMEFNKFPIIFFLIFTHQTYIHSISFDLPLQKTTPFCSTRGGALNISCSIVQNLSRDGLCISIERLLCNISQFAKYVR